MPQLEHKSFNSPDEKRNFTSGFASLVNFAGGIVSQVTLQPGWRWSKDVKPITQTELCQDVHILYVVSGRLAVAMADGTQTEIGPGEVALIPPGHDGWVVGDEPCVNVDWGGMDHFARPLR